MPGTEPEGEHQGVDSIQEVEEEVEGESLEDELLDDGASFDSFDPMQQLTQLFVTESGVPIVDVLQGIQEAHDKQNKILYKLVSILEKNASKPESDGHSVGNA